MQINSVLKAIVPFFGYSSFPQQPSHPTTYGSLLKLWANLKLPQLTRPNPIKTDSFNGFLHRLFQPVHPRSSREIITPFHENKFQPAMLVLKSFPLHQNEGKLIEHRLLVSSISHRLLVTGNYYFK